MKTKLYLLVLILLNTNIVGQIKLPIDQKVISKSTKYPQKNRWIDSFQKLDSIVVSTNHSLRTTQKKTKYYFEYDNAGNNILYTFQTFDTIAQSWVNYKQYLYSYNINNQITERISEDWDDTTQTWKNNYKETYIYNTNSLLETYFFERWNENSLQWDQAYKEEYTYDTNNLLTESITYNFSSGNYVPSIKVVYQYDYRQNLIDETYYQYNNNNWYNSAKYEYTYDNTGLLTGYTSFDWDSNTNNWIPNWKTVFEFDNNNYLLLSISSYEWDTNTNDWIFDDKTQYYYDTLNNVIKYEYYDETYGLTHPVSYGDFDYDNNFENNNLLLPYLLKNISGFYFKHMLIQLTEYDDYDINTDAYNSQNLYNFYYSPLNTNKLDETSKNNPVIYPNPTTGYIQIKLPEKIQEADIQLFDMQGRTVLKTKLSQAFNLNINNLKPSVYIVKIKSGNKIYSSQIIKK